MEACWDQQERRRALRRNRARRPRSFRSPCQCRQRTSSTKPRWAGDGRIRKRLKQPMAFHILGWMMLDRGKKNQVNSQYGIDSRSIPDVLYDIFRYIDPISSTPMKVKGASPMECLGMGIWYQAEDPLHFSHTSLSATADHRPHQRRRSPHVARSSRTSFQKSPVMQNRSGLDQLWVWTSLGWSFSPPRARVGSGTVRSEHDHEPRAMRRPIKAPWVVRCSIACFRP